MWEQYKKTFWRIQIPISIIGLAVYLVTHGNWRNAAFFWMVMQLSALIGANWASRVRRFVDKDRVADLRKDAARPDR